MLARQKAGNKSSDKENITRNVVYTGAVWYGAWPVFRTFIDSAREFLEKYPECKEKVHFDFIGTGLHKDKRKNNWLGQYARSRGLEKSVTETCKSQLYLDAINCMLQADVLLLVGPPERYYMASKLFPYLQTGKPIIAIIHQSSPMLDILDTCDNVRIITYNDTEKLPETRGKIVKALSGCLLNAGTGKTGKHQIVDAYTAEAVTSRFASILDDIISEN